MVSDAERCLLHPDLGCANGMIMDSLFRLWHPSECCAGACFHQGIKQKSSSLPRLISVRTAYVWSQFKIFQQRSCRLSPARNVQEEMCSCLNQQMNGTHASKQTKSVLVADDFSHIRGSRVADGQCIEQVRSIYPPVTSRGCVICVFHDSCPTAHMWHISFSVYNTFLK